MSKQIAGEEEVRYLHAARAGSRLSCVSPPIYNNIIPTHSLLTPHLLTLYTWGDKGLLIIITNIKSDTSLQGVTPALYIAHP